MNQRISQADREFVAALQRSGPQRIRQLCDTHGVTPTAVRHRLSRLVDQGLIARRSIPAGRGRPYHEYAVTEMGQQALGNDYASLAKLLWREVGRLDADDVRQQLIEGLRAAMVRRYGLATSGATVSERFGQLQKALEREGFDVEIDQRETSGELLPVLREHACPYHDLAAEDRSICELEQSVFEDVLGVPVSLARCCHDGHNCCEFEPAMSG